MIQQLYCKHLHLQLENATQIRYIYLGLLFTYPRSYNRRKYNVLKSKVKIKRQKKQAFNIHFITYISLNGQVLLGKCLYIVFLNK